MSHAGCCACLLAFTTLFATPLFAMSYGTATINNKTCDTVTWTDANGKERSVALVRANGDRNGFKGGYIERYTYFIGNTQATGMAYNAGQEGVSGLGCAVNHYANTSASSKTNTNNATSAFLLQGAHHALWRFSGDYAADKTVKIVIDYFFSEGRNDFLWSVSYDCSQNADKAMSWDARGPYVQFDWNNDGNFYNTPISGIRWGDKYKFKTVNYVYNTPASTTWDYATTNTIPYTSIYKNAANGDTEMSFVQTQPWTVQDAGGYWWSGNWGKTGTGMPENWNCPYQLNAYENYSGEKMAWGTNYGYVGDSAYDVLGFEKKAAGYPHQGYAVHILLNQTAQNATDALIGEMETVQRTAFTASTGTVATTGQDHAGIANSATYQPAGWNHVYSVWTVTANASNQATVNFSISSGSLQRPTLQVKNYTAASAPTALTLNGTALAANEFAASVDATNKVLYVTLTRNLSGTANTLAINATGNPPPPPPPPAGATKLFLFAGQSNMVGAGTDATQLTLAQQQPLSAVKIFVADLSHDPSKGTAVAGPYWLPPNGSFANYAAGGHNNAGNWWKGTHPGDWWQTKAFGPEWSCARDLAAGLNENVLVAKYAVGATTLSGNWNPANANPGGDAEYQLSLYNSMKAWANQALTEARKADANAQIAGFFWMQGEGDAFQPMAGQYQANFTNLIAKVRQDFGANLPFVFGRISNSTIWTDRAVVRAAQAAVDTADAKAAMVDTDDLPIAADQAHYTTPGIVTLGERFAAAYFQLVPPTQPPPPPPPPPPGGGGGTNVAPAFQSTPTATPSQALVNQPVLFSASATDANGDALTYTWDFGPLGTQTGATITHVFTAPGNYTVNLTVSDGAGGAAVWTLTVSVVAPASTLTDSDGDGASDDQEKIDGTNPNDPNSVKVFPMTVLKASGAVQFTRTGRDGVSLSGKVLGLPLGYDPANSTAMLNAGGASVTFLLDAKGRGKSNGSTFSLSLKPSKRDKATKKVVFQGGDAAFKAKLSKGDWSDDWSDEGVKADFSGTAALAMELRLSLGGKLYGVTLNATYSGKAGKSGRFKNSK